MSTGIESMRILSNLPPVNKQSSKNQGPKRNDHPTGKTVKNLSENEIRDRIEAHRLKNPKDVFKNSFRTSMPENFSDISEKSDIEKPVAKEIDLNDPKNPLAISKLKNVLEKGGFNFSTREREVLGKILSK